MYDSKGLWLAIPLALLCGAVAVLLTGCDLSLSQPTPVPGAPTDTPVPTQPTAAPTEVTPPAPAVITLTIWTTEVFSPTQAITSGQILAQQAVEFEATHPDARLEFVLKKSYGKGGILDYLLTTKAAVPDLLPDLVFIDVSELEAAMRAELVQPLDSLIPGDLAGDLYPFATGACTFDGRLYGLQFQADMDHLVYNTGKMTVPPSSWPGVLSNPGPYLFPAGGQAGLVNDAFLIQYLAVRPWPVTGDPDAPFLDQDSLIAVFQFYQDGISRGIIPGDIVEYHTTDDCWRTYLEGETAMSQVGAHRYLQERDRTQNSALAPIPSINGPAPAIGRGWALALVASDPARQSAAVDLMGLFMAPEANAAWNQAANFLPTRKAALANWDMEDSYTPFIDQQLQAAQARPSIPNYTRIAAALQKAVEDVINGAATPEEAAAEVIESTQ
jgi:multiple sugar transport system substrate-binding protein